MPKKKNEKEVIQIWDNILFWLIFLFSGTIIIALFFYLNHVQPYYFVDELFHIPQTLKYCKRQYLEWHPKITTFPGLYLLTSTILAPFDLCKTIWIRSTNLIGTFINLYLIINITKYLGEADNQNSQKKWWIQIVSAYNITFLPPLFFFFFLYYTDVFSVTMILSMFLLHLKKHFNIAAIPGFAAILIRQTNIIWLFLLASEYCLDVMDHKSKQLFSTKSLNRNGMIDFLKRLWYYVIFEIRQGPIQFSKFIIYTCYYIWAYILCGLLFFAFLIWNKSIVIGDHNSHMLTIHLPQIFYFSVFTFLFSWPYMLPCWKDFLKNIQKHWILTSCFFIFAVIIVHKNTLVHQYVLADNRHFIFYVWNKFMNKYEIFKYLLVPVYTFTTYSFLKCISHLRPSVQITYLFCVSAVLIPQLLLEPRYFIIPYIIFRLNLKCPETWQIIMEFATMLLINFLQFFIFINKTFYWQDFKHPQRIGW